MAHNLEARVTALEVESDARESPVRDARLGARRIVSPTVNLGALDREASSVSTKSSTAPKLSAGGAQQSRALELGQPAASKQPSFGALPLPAATDRTEDEVTPEPWC